MSKKYLILFVIIILALPINFGIGFYLGYKFAPPKTIISNALPASAVVTKVFDGDTIEINTPQKISIRYLGIDAPDKGKPNYKESKEYNEKLVLGKKITLEYDENQNDKYGRILAWVWINGKLINQEMITSGYAIPLIMENQKLKYDLKISPQ